MLTKLKEILLRKTPHEVEQDRLLSKIRQSYACPDCNGDLFCGSTASVAMDVQCGSCKATFNVGVANGDIFYCARL